MSRRYSLISRCLRLCAAPVKYPADWLLRFGLNQSVWWKTSRERSSKLWWRGQSCMHTGQTKIRLLTGYWDNPSIFYKKMSFTKAGLDEQLTGLSAQTKWTCRSWRRSRWKGRERDKEREGEMLSIEPLVHISQSSIWIIRCTRSYLT